MSVILNPKDYEQWLTRTNSQSLKSLLKPYPKNDLKMYRVSRIANSTKNNIPLAIKRVDIIAVDQKKLF